MNSRPVITLTRKLTNKIEERLACCFDVRLNSTDQKLSNADLKRAMQESDAVLCTVSDSMAEDVLNVANRRASMIANFGVGYSNIDIDTARRKGIVVSNTPDVLTDATADIALLLILAVTRRAYAFESLLRTGDWRGFAITDNLGMSIQNKVLGVIGMGRIGRAVARRAALGFGMQIAYYNRSEINNNSFDYPAVAHESIESIMANSDVVSLHIPGRGGKGPVISADLIARMKPNAFLINTARGDVVDEQALIQALESQQIAGAGLDVYLDEPKVPEKLRMMKNVTLLPHIGSATQEVRDVMGMLAVDNLLAHFNGGEYPSRVV